MNILAEIAEYEKDPLLRRHHGLKEHVKHNTSARLKRKRKRKAKKDKK